MSADDEYDDVDAATRLARLVGCESPADRNARLRQRLWGFRPADEKETDRDSA